MTMMSRWTTKTCWTNSDPMVVAAAAAAAFIRRALIVVSYGVHNW